MPLSLNCVFVNRCGLASTLTVKRFSMCFHKNPFLVSWACQKSFFSNMHNVVLHASFRLSKRAVVTKQSKTPSYETPNWLFCPLFWLHSILVAFHLGCMSIFDVCSTFFDACCSEAQNHETKTISPQLLMTVSIVFLQGVQEKQLTVQLTGLKKRCS